MNDDNYIVRTKLRSIDFKFRGDDMSSKKLSRIKKGFHSFHTLETMAVNIYKFQIAKNSNELNRQLIVAMSNEMSHFQDFQIKLYEYGFKPNKSRWPYWIVGFIFGTFSRLLGEKAILKTGVWVEKKAVRHYGKLLQAVEWDAETRKVIEQNRADEYGHLQRWERLLEI